MAWIDYTIPLDEVKNYLKVDHDLENALIIRLTAAAILKARQLTNRDFEQIPEDIELGILKTIAFWYENRSDEPGAAVNRGGSRERIPTDAEQIFATYYRFPGL